MKKVSKKLIDETKALIKFSLFLRYEVRLREADSLTAG